MHTRSFRILSVAAALLSLAGAAHADTRRIVLSGDNGESVVIGTLTLQPDGPDAWTFRLDLDASRFVPRFLSMRPFQCLTGPRQQICHFPYGEERRFTRTDLQPLEYQLMFLHKKPADVNVDPRNGMYYRLSWEGERLVGQLMDVDMDPIVVPGEDRRRPIKYPQLLDIDRAAHWLPRLELR